MANNNKEQYRNVVDTSLVAGNSDDRLPSSLLTLEEYYQSLAIAQECSLNKDKQNIRNLSISSPEHPYYPLYKYFKTVAQKLKGTEFEHHCVICGEELSLYTHYPYCNACGRLAYRGIIRGKSRTRGFRNVGRMCIVCNKRPAASAGMCRACYRFGDRRGIHDPDKIRQIRQSIKKTKSQEDQETIENLKVPAGFMLKVWDI